ncbi:uncharacterized protein LOC113126569 isoform X2 [Mastacembelus armatus]|uniref:uncharacterized protein LOC113126569 isoform X2 n=1 Tax=Mastacembelus armatus TaxID=205130 RepID=UPI000E459C52|nr:uncharacterized protein LOC113126569 isoform X2 [Mastacembelus armatus]
MFAATPMINHVKAFPHKKLKAIFHFIFLQQQWKIEGGELIYSEVEVVSVVGLTCRSLTPHYHFRGRFLQIQNPFRINGLKIIKMMLDSSEVTPGSTHLVDELLHSIFFLGKINQVPFTPEEIIGQGMVERLSQQYPGPFQHYLDQVPKRSPFSCVMDMVVLQQGQEREEEIRQSLTKLVGNLKPKFLVSSTICVSWEQTSPARYYGVSLSTYGPTARNIVTAASCCSVWDDYVAGAVMTYYPANIQNEPNGAIRLPDNVRCQAFDIRSGSEKNPCLSCGNMFGLYTEETDEFPYGNCAETESVSNLLKREAEVRENTQLQSDAYTAENRQMAREQVRNILSELLQGLNINWDGNFYNPAV